METPTVLHAADSNNSPPSHPAVSRERRGWIPGVLRSAGLWLACLTIMQIATVCYGQCDAGHTYWEVSTRCLSDSPNCQVMPNFRVGTNAYGAWSTSSVEQLIAHCQEHSSNRLVVYVHGNWMDASDARTRGLTIYKKLQCHSVGSITFVAFTWPSEKRQGFARDVWAKKDRTDAESVYLAQLLPELASDQPPGLLGFSFGGRILVGALHLLGGGNLAGRQLPGQPTRFASRLTLFAPAFDRTGLGKCGSYNRALTCVSQVVNLYNSTDPVLRRFRFFDRQSRPIAAGFSGLVINGLMPLQSDSSLEPGPKIEQYDCRTIGRSHAELDYFKCSAISGAIRNILGQ